MSPRNKNEKLAKENNELKSIISQKMQIQEEIMKKSIKAEYNRILSYKEMIRTLDGSIEALEGSLEQCKKIRQSVLNNRSFLSDTTNIMKNGKEDQKCKAQCDDELVIEPKNKIKEINNECNNSWSVENELFNRWGNKDHK
jgi:hypothetical protein